MPSISPQSFQGVLSDPNEVVMFPGGGFILRVCSLDFFFFAQAPWGLLRANRVLAGEGGSFLIGSFYFLGRAVSPCADSLGESHRGGGGWASRPPGQTAPELCPGEGLSTWISTEAVLLHLNQPKFPYKSIWCLRIYYILESLNCFLPFPP